MLDAKVFGEVEQRERHPDAVGVSCHAVEVARRAQAVPLLVP